MKKSRDDDDDSLTAAEWRELQRRVADSRDPTRYLVVSKLGPRHTFYFDVVDGNFTLNRPAGGTLFKRRKHALAVAALLGKRHRVVRCSTRRKAGVLVPVLPKRAKKGGKG